MKTIRINIVILIFSCLGCCNSENKSTIFNQKDIKKHFEDSVAYITNFDSLQNNTFFKKFVRKFNLPYKNYDQFTQLFYVLDEELVIDDTHYFDSTIRLTALPCFSHPYCLKITSKERLLERKTETKIMITDGDGAYCSGMRSFEKTRSDSITKFNKLLNTLEANDFWINGANYNVDSLTLHVYDGTEFRLEVNLDGKYKVINFRSYSKLNPKLFNIMSNLMIIKEEIDH